MILAKGGWEGMGSFLSQVFNIWGDTEVTMKSPACVTP